MSAQATLERTFEAFDRHDPEAFASLYSPDAVAYDPQYPEPLRGRDAIRKDVEDFFRTFPDVRSRVSLVLADGRSAGCEWELSGTNAGPLVTPEGTVDPTNRSVRLPGSRFIRVDDRGLITEDRRYYDLAGLMQQLGLA